MAIQSMAEGYGISEFPLTDPQGPKGYSPHILLLWFFLGRTSVVLVHHNQGGNPVVTGVTCQSTGSSGTRYFLMDMTRSYVFVAFVFQNR